ncbi:siderophore-interacting protein [Kocuria sp.]|uniref:siderophore-interacting protein n=1 Tax=Kocuria sp. TaxID=1871328 RepID=UPI0026DAD2F0|nr:siderophore-interacting protein [Kocuria sp.]MDO4919288.1 siderophore-interacting protein [Kocuria sp.]
MTTPPAPTRKPQLDLTVLERIQLSPAMVRVVCRIENPEDFRDVPAPEKYVKLLFFPPAVADSAPGGFPDYWAVREAAAPQDQPVSRHMTLRRVDTDTATVWIDVALHGAAGFAGPWAGAAAPGNRIVALGPGGTWVPDPEATWTLLAGDDAAVPAVLANLEALPASARGEVVLEVADAAHELDLGGVAVPEGMRVRWVHRATQAPGERALVTALAGAAWPEDVSGVQVFVHGEREAMKAARRELFEVRGLERSQVSLSGYWAQGRTEDMFQAEKKLPVGKII